MPMAPMPSGMLCCLHSALGAVERGLSVLWIAIPICRRVCLCLHLALRMVCGRLPLPSPVSCSFALCFAYKWSKNFSQAPLLAPPLRLASPYSQSQLDCPAWLGVQCRWNKSRPYMGRVVALDRY